MIPMEKRLSRLRKSLFFFPAVLIATLRFDGVLSCVVWVMWNTGMCVVNGVCSWLRGASKCRMNSEISCNKLRKLSVMPSCWSTGVNMLTNQILVMHSATEMWTGCRDNDGEWATGGVDDDRTGCSRRQGVNGRGWERWWTNRSPFWQTISAQYS